MRISKSLFVACALVSCVPAQPEPADDVATVVEDRSVLIEVRANDRHVDRIAVFSGASSHGTVRIVGDAILYTPDPDFTGTDEFDYAGYNRERDADGYSGMLASVTVTVTPDRAAQLTQDVMSPAWPDSVAIADFDRDGLLDLVTLNQDRSVVVSLQRKNGEQRAFEPVVVHAAEIALEVILSARRNSLVVSDLDLDGLPDIAFVSYRDAVFLYNRTAKALAFETVRLAVGDIAIADSATLAVGDVNCDGAPDLVTETWAGGGDRLWVVPSLSLAGGVISHDPPIEFPDLWISTRSLLRLARDEDGCDVIYFTSDGTLRRSLRQQDGSLSFQRIVDLAEKPEDLAVVDLDGDALPEILQGASPVSIAPGSDAPTIELEGDGDLLAVGDFDGDRKKELAFTDWCEVRFYSIHAEESLSFEAQGDIPAFQGAACPYITGLAVADLDGDGRDDLALAHGDSYSEQGELLTDNGVIVIWSHEASQD